MTIREANATDAEAVSDLVSALSDKYIASDLSAEGRVALLRSMTPDAIRKYMNTGYRYHVAEARGQIVGVVGVRDNKHLYHLFVAEDYQGKGVARALWHIAKQSSELAGNSAEFTVNSSQYAKGLYEKLGFVAQSGPVEKNGVVFIPMKLTISG
jgi:ribosomal protein S18 acetylase RimI-like enzyme